MLTTADLKSHTKADLTEMAKRFGLPVSGSMRKDELAVAVAKASKAKKSAGKGAKPEPKSSAKSSSAKSSAQSNQSQSSKAKLTSGSSRSKASKSTVSKSTATKSTATKSRAGSKSTAIGAAKARSSNNGAAAKPAGRIAAAKTKTSVGSKSRTGAKGSAGQAAAQRPTSKVTASKTPVSKATVSKGNKLAANARKSQANQAARGSASKLSAAASAAQPATSQRGSKKQPVPKPVSRKQTRALAGVSSAGASSPLEISASAKTVSSKTAARGQPAPSSTDPQVLKRIRELQLQRQTSKDLTSRPTLIRPPGAIEPILDSEPRKDRIALFVRDAHWLHATWDITRHAIERAKAAMMEHWHGAKPILRLIRMDDTGTTNTSETTERDIEIHGGLRNWYIEWSGETANFRVLIGYLSTSGRFHAIAKSNIVKTPGAGTTDAVDEHWSDLGAESERIFAVSGGYDEELDSGELKEMLEDRLRRSLGAPPLAKLGAGADSPFRQRGGFHFEMEVELIAYGSTVPDGYLTLNGEPVALRSDGTFALRVPFPDRRQVLPAVACSRDGSQQRTIVVAVERNTKIMEPLESEEDVGE